MGEQERELAAFLGLLDSCDCLQHVILVGSWAEYLYGKSGLLPGFSPSIRTLDIDFLVRNLRKPVPSTNVAAVAREAGYLVSSDCINGITRIYDKKGLEIEFLIGKVGAGLEPALRTNLGVTAQALRHMEILHRGAMTVDFLGMRVTVPSPEAYVLHKMVINQERGAKSEKDRAAVERLMPFLDKARLNKAFEALSRKEKGKVQSFLEINGGNQYCE